MPEHHKNVMRKNSKIARTLVSDKIMNTIKNSNELSPEAVDYFTNMFDPMKGLNLSVLT